jgi:hypothetical protein
VSRIQLCVVIGMLVSAVVFFVGFTAGFLVEGHDTSRRKSACEERQLESVRRCKEQIEAMVMRVCR